MRAALLFPLLTLGGAVGDAVDEIVIGEAVELTAESCGAADVGPVVGGVDILETFRLAQANMTSEPPPMGLPRYNWTDEEGYTFYFLSQANADEFGANQNKYPLGSGGYCGLASSGIDPSCAFEGCKGPACITEALYEISTDGKLYFFFGADGQVAYDDGEPSSSAGSAALLAKVEADKGGKCYNTDYSACTPALQHLTQI